MKPDPSSLRQRHHDDQSIASRQENHLKQEVEFATAEEMIRFDTAQTEVPGEIAERLTISIQNEPKPDRPWWRRLFS